MSEEKTIVEGPKNVTKRYCANPGFRFSGLPDFPFETDDPEIQERIEGSFQFLKADRVWLDNKSDEERSAEELALSGVSFHKLRKMAHALGKRDINKLTKADLIDVIAKEM